MQRTLNTLDRILRRNFQPVIVLGRTPQIRTIRVCFEERTHSFKYISTNQHRIAVDKIPIKQRCECIDLKFVGREKRSGLVSILIDGAECRMNQTQGWRRFKDRKLHCQLILFKDVVRAEPGEEFSLHLPDANIDRRWRPRWTALIDEELYDPLRITPDIVLNDLP